MKGFVISLISVSLISLLVAFSSSLHNEYLAMERALSQPQPLAYAAFMFDRVAYDVNAIAGPNISIIENSSGLGIFVADTVPKDNYTGRLSAYENFIESAAFSNATHAAIDGNFSNMSFGVLTLLIDQDYTYTNDPGGSDMLFTSAGGTNATYYEINVTVLQNTENVTHFNFNSSGDLNLTLHYTDLNTTLTESGTVFSDQANSFKITYASGGTLNITVGQKSGNPGSLYIKAQNVNASTSWFAALPRPKETKKLGYSYNATLSYIQGGIAKTARIGKN
jgi:hypothetical protein